MDSKFYVMNDDGKVQKLGPCRGFAIFPGKAADAPRATQLGSYPLVARLRGFKDFFFSNDAAYYFSAEKPFIFDLLGVAGESWQVCLFDDPQEGARASGSKTRLPCEVFPAGTAIAVVAPAAAGDGFALRPADRVLQFYVDGDAQDIALWQQALDGTWRKAEDTFVSALDARPIIKQRDVNGAIGRLALVAAGGVCTFGLDKEQEAG